MLSSWPPSDWQISYILQWFHVLPKAVKHINIEQVKIIVYNSLLGVWTVVLAIVRNVYCFGSTLVLASIRRVTQTFNMKAQLVFFDIYSKLEINVNCVTVISTCSMTPSTSAGNCEAGL